MEIQLLYDVQSNGEICLYFMKYEEGLSIVMIWRTHHKNITMKYIHFVHHK